MRMIRGAPLVLALCLLTACGGGGGMSSAGSNPSLNPPPPPPPPVTNSTITNLQASESFVNDAASSTLAFDLTTGTTISATGGPSTLSVSYDATAKSYTVATSGRNQAFAPADLVASSLAGESQYQRTNGGNIDHLTLVTTPFDTSTSNQYVGLGFWQRNQVTGNRQDTTFDIFTYGLASPAGAVPRTGTAAYEIDAFGLFAKPGSTPQTLQGLGTFNVDFLNGIFALDAPLTQFDVITGASQSGGGVDLLASGHLSSTDATFTGNLSYQSPGGLVAGTVNGRFYGPAAQELGAAFSASNAAGAVLVGGLTGQKGSGPATQSLALTNLVAPQLFFAFGAELQAVGSGTAIRGANALQMIGQLTQQTDGSFSYGPGNSDLQFASYSAADQIAGRANFTTYQKVVNGQTLTVAVFKNGSSNSELALTYATFGIWQQDSGSASLPKNDKQVFFAYGLATPFGVLAARTGSAHYNGVAYGGAVDDALGARYGLTGTSIFDVDFSAQDYTGSLALHGTQDGTGAARDFGTFTFMGNVGNNGSTATVAQNGVNVGQLVNDFYGPDAEEIAGTFTMHVNAGAPNQVTIAGATAAKRH